MHSDWKTVSFTFLVINVAFEKYIRTINKIYKVKFPSHLEPLHSTSPQEQALLVSFLAFLRYFMHSQAFFLFSQVVTHRTCSSACGFFHLTIYLGGTSTSQCKEPSLKRPQNIPLGEYTGLNLPLSVSTKAQSSFLSITSNDTCILLKGRKEGRQREGKKDRKEESRRERKRRNKKEKEKGGGREVGKAIHQYGSEFDKYLLAHILSARPVVKL